MTFEGLSKEEKEVAQTVKAHLETEGSHRWSPFVYGPLLSSLSVFSNWKQKREIVLLFKALRDDIRRYILSKY